jgi:hypothetical protein
MQRDINIPQFVTKYGDSLLSAFVSIITGAVTAAVSGNIVDGVRIAAVGIGKLVVDIMRTPAPTVEGEKRSFARKTTSFAKRSFSVVMITLIAIAVAIALLFIAVVAWLLRSNEIVIPTVHVPSPPIPAADMPTITVNNQDDDEYQDRSPVRNKASIIAINEWKDGDTLSGCDRDGANMARRILQTWHVPEEKITRALEQYWANEKGVYVRVRHADNELRILRNDRATCERGKKALQWFVTGANPNDIRFWYNSGHGTQTPSKTELDLLNECVVMYDHNDKPDTWFLDDLIGDATKDAPNPSDFMFLLDICHGEGFLRGTNEGFSVRYKKPSAHIAKMLEGRSAKSRLPEDDSYTNDNVLLLSGCTSDSVSYSSKYVVDGKEVMEGALTHNFLKIHAQNPRASREDIHTKLYALLAASKYAQEPQLQGSQRLRKLPFLGV